MKNKLNAVLLIDDNEDDNFIHERVIRKSGLVETVYVASSGFEAMRYLSNFDQLPQLIFLDINMPQVNGFEFLEAYKKVQHANNDIVIIMLTTSLNPADKQKAAANELIKEFITKPLTAQAMQEIANRYFQQ